MRIESKVVRSTRQGERVIWIARVWHFEGGEIVDLKLFPGRKVVSNVVRVLFGEPDCIVSCYHHTHNTSSTVRWDHLVKSLCTRIKDSQKVMPHLTKPETPLVINSRTHQAATCFRQRILPKTSYSQSSRSSACRVICYGGADGGVACW